MTTPAERLRRALPPRPKGGYELGSVAGDTAAVLDQLDARGTGLTPDETAARDVLRAAITDAIKADRNKHANAGTRASGDWFSESHADAVWLVIEPAFARLDAEVAAARLTLTEREVDYQAALTALERVKALCDASEPSDGLQWPFTLQPFVLTADIRAALSGAPEGETL